MSFGGFGGFGQQNTSSTTGGFGGFGANNNTNTTTSAFGQSSTPAFGSANTNTGGGLFGGGGSSGGGGFGSSTGGGFGSTSNAFGAKPAFGAAPTSTSGGLFGSTPSTTGGGFGSGAFGANTTSSTGFGSGTGNTMFGANKPAFGAANTSTTGSSGLFGGNSTPFGGGGGGGFGAAGTSTLGGAVPDPPGTAVAPFQPYLEKEGTSNAQNSFQSILFQDPYKKYSHEELRLVDYAQGRQFGNGPSGAAGAFGTTSGFGTTGGFGTATQTTGFGGNNNNSTGLFGGNNNQQSSSAGFGGANTTNNTFGGGGLFGPNKPASTGLFGNTPASQPTQSSGLFGGSGTSGFGSTGTTNAFGTTPSNTGTGLFGGNNNNQAKPAGNAFGGGGGGFGSTTGNAFGTANTNAFGSNTNTSNTGGGLFGGGAQTQNSTGGGLFGGGNTQQTTQTSGFGGGFGTQPQSSGSNLFGNQPKTGGGLFGPNTAAQPSTGTGGLFGTNTTSSPFGQPNNTAQQTGGLFSNKPATTTTGGLFGGGTQQQTGQTGGLFGGLGTANQAQQPATNSLFSGAAQAKPNLFGAPAQSTGTGLFGQPQQQPTGGLFGGATAQQPQQNTMLGSSLFNTTSNAQANPQGLTASISDVNAFGTPSLFAGLGSNEIHNPGPLATPLSSNKQAARKGGALPMWKLNPGSGSKFVTPVKRGFGFSYSTYGSPATPSGNGTTSGTFGQSLLGGSNLNRSANKAFSSSTLRKTINTDDSILSPGAFTASIGPRSYGSGRLNKLTVDKSLRVDLFTPISKEKTADSSIEHPRKLPKRVSFDTSNVEPGNGSPSIGSSVNSTPDLGYIRAPHGISSELNGAASRSPSGAPEMEQIRGNELAVVPEEQSAASSPNASAAGTSSKEAGKYWMSPSRDELLKMNRVQLSQVADFTVGRDNVGHVRFLVPVDLTNIDIDTIIGEIVILDTRSCTVYPDNIKKAPVGKGLNVPSEISLLYSWPRNMDKKTGLPIKEGRYLEKHIRKLQSSPDTTFVSYNPEDGNWTFTVEHFTTYGLDYDDDDTDGETLGDTSVDDIPMPSPSKPLREGMETSPSEEMDEDTSESRRKRRALLPGAFDYTGAISEDDEEADDVNQQSFLSERSAGFASEVIVSHDDNDMDAEHALSMEQAPSAYLGHHQAAEPDFDSPYHGSMAEYQEMPGGIMRARLQAINRAHTPLKIQVADGDDWTDMLQKTISHQKRDRAALKAMNEEATYESLKESIREMDRSPAKPQAVSDGRGFATSIDLMNSLFEKPKTVARPATQVSIPTSGFKWQYKRPDHTEQEDLDPNDKAFHDALRPSWGPDGTLVVAAAPKVLSRSSKRAFEKDGILSICRMNAVSQSRDIRFAKFANESSAKALANQISLTSVNVVDNVPTVGLGSVDSLTAFFHGQDLQSPSSSHEKMVWELASILFDQVLDAQGGLVPPSELRQARRHNLSKFWQNVVEEAATRDISLAHTVEDKAIAALSGHRIPDACKYLLDGKNFRLATLVSLIGNSDQLMQDMREQVKEWRESNVLSEFPDPLRAIYELLGGNACVVEGRKGAMENRMNSFVISDKFGMDWKRSFGLRLWYAIASNDDVVEAIHAFEEDMKQDKEKRPQPWFAEQGIQALWEDPDLEQREDLLWGLLKLYADKDAELADILRPENSQLSPLDFRLSWQLGQALVNTGKVDFGENANEKADATTLAFASQLSAEGNWLEAIFVLLHLHDATARIKAIQEQLSHHAHLVGSETSEDFSTLTQTFKIPAAWIWQAKALYQRAVKKDAKSEVIYLLRAASYAEAHKTLVKQVAPLSIIECDYEGLWDMLAQFSSAESSIADWNVGGKIYLDFLTVMQHVQQGNVSEVPAGLVKSLMSGLPAMRESVQVRGDADVIEVAAVADMANVVAKVVVELSKKRKAPFSKVLNLPLTEDAYLKYSNELALRYYQDVMAGAGN